MSPFTIAQYSYSSNAAKQIFRRGATMIIGLSNKTSVQCRSQSSTPQEICTQSRCYIPAPRCFSAYKTNGDSKQCYATHCIHSSSQRRLFGTHSLHSGSATAVAEARIPMRIIKAMGRWSSDVYRSYIRTPHRILRSLTNQQILCIIELHEQVY